jgi:hypothetical protein
VEATQGGCYDSSWLVSSLLWWRSTNRNDIVDIAGAHVFCFHELLHRRWAMRPAVLITVFRDE